MEPEDQCYNSTAVIYLNRLAHNVHFLKQYLANDVMQMAVIKADAYGHGAVETARFLQDKVDWFAVASVQEAIRLRKSGVGNNILVFAPPTVHTGFLYPQYDITAVISNFGQMKWLGAGAVYHLQFDTGMGRFGFYADEVEQVLAMTKKYPSLHLSGIMTHFASADDPDNESVSVQMKLFHSVRKHFDDDLLYHAANSGGVLFYPETHLSMVRLGIGMYGYQPGDTKVEGLQPVMKWGSYLISVKPLRKGMTLSYHSLWKCPRDGYFGVVPVGYADGYPRNLTGKAHMIVEGRKYPVAGVVTMDYCMIYLGKDRYEPGTPVTLMGDGPVTADDIARQLGTISYEILCGINRRRVNRVYRYEE